MAGLTVWLYGSGATPAKAADPSDELLIASVCDAQRLKARAEELWGAWRASELQKLLDKTAEHVWQIAQHPPDDEEEPGFYF